MFVIAIKVWLLEH